MQEPIALPEIGIVGGLEMAQKANKALETIATCWYGTAEPNPTYPLMWWGDQGNQRMKQRNSANSAWIDRGPLDVDQFGLAPAGQFRAYANSPADMTVKVAAGAVQTGGAVVTQAVQTTAAFVAPAANPRNDLLVIDQKTGVLSVVAGAEAAAPADPAIPAGKVAKGRVHLVVGMTEITASDIDDLRAAHVSEAGYSTVASSATPDVWSAGETIKYTGTATSTGFPAAPYAGAMRTLLVDSYGAKFTLGANMVMDGFSSGYTYTCYAGMIVDVFALTTTTFRLYVRPYATQWSIPAHFNMTNLAGSTNNYGHFSIVRETVSYSYGFYADPTTASIQTVLGIALGEGQSSPPASAFVGVGNGSGVAVNAVDNAVGSVYPDAATGRLLVEMYPPSAANRYWKMTGQFRML